MKKSSNKLTANLPAKLLSAWFGAALLGISCGAALADDDELYSTKVYDSDAAITQRVEQALRGQPGVNTDNVKVEVFQGMVQLSGHMDSHVGLVTALAVVERVGGIKTVRNYLVENAPKQTYTVEIAQEPVTSSDLQLAANSVSDPRPSTATQGGAP